MDNNSIKEKIKSFIDRGELINKKERHLPEDGLLFPEYVSGPLLDEWINEIYVFNERYLKSHSLYGSIKKICESYKKLFSPCDDMIGKLKAVLSDEDFWKENDIELDKNDLLALLIEIEKKDGNIYLSTNDERFIPFSNLDELLNELNDDGFFSIFKKDVIGGIEIKLSNVARDNNSSKINTNREKDSHNKLFISHSSADKEVGELFLDFLLSLGFKNEDIFYSSKYHNGVELGKNFSDVVKDNFQKSDTIIYLLTPNFYKSEYCNNEIGAGWISDNKSLIPILLGGLGFDDMKGFVSSQTKAFSVSSSEQSELYTYFARRTSGDFDEATAKQKYESFLKCPINNSSSVNIQLNEKELIIIKGLKKSSNGMIPYFTALNAVTISIDGKNICEGLPLSEKLEFKDAVEHLSELGYVKKGNMLLSLTGKGAKIDI